MKYKKLVIKIGSNVLTNAEGLPDMQVMEDLTSQVAELKKKGADVVLVSSGAVAFGRSVLSDRAEKDTIAERQLLAAVGQVKVVEAYDKLFRKYGLYTAQVVVTQEDFRDRRHYLNMKNCLNALLQNNIIPIVNENDVVAVSELMFTDNDELAGLVTGMMDFDALLILTNVDGIYNKPPEEDGAEVISIIKDKLPDFNSFVSKKKSAFGRGGMITKCHIAAKISKLGVHVHIGNGKKKDIIAKILSFYGEGTHFVAKQEASGVKKWLAYSDGFVKGRIRINDGAKKAISERMATSILPIGISMIEGEFRKGDIVRIMDSENKQIGLGKAQYGSESALDKIGRKNQKPLIHYDYLFLF